MFSTIWTWHAGNKLPKQESAVMANGGHIIKTHGER